MPRIVVAETTVMKLYDRVVGELPRPVEGDGANGSRDGIVEFHGAVADEQHSAIIEQSGGVHGYGGGIVEFHAKPGDEDQDLAIGEQNSTTLVGECYAHAARRRERSGSWIVDLG